MCTQTPPGDTRRAMARLRHVLARAASPLLALALSATVVVLAFAGGGGVAGAHAAGAGGSTVIEGTLFIGEDTVWTSAGSPYEIRGAVIISPTVTLTIEKGVRVALKPGGFAGKGNLVIRGAPGERVVVEDPAPAQPGFAPQSGISVEGRQEVQYADLTNIRLQGCVPFGGPFGCPSNSHAPTVSFDHVNFLGDSIRFAAARVRITNSVIARATQGTQVAGEIIGNLIWLAQRTPDATILMGALTVGTTVMSNTIIYNGEGGLYVGSSTDITVTGNNIYGNVPWDVKAWIFASSGTPRAPGNWWGTTDIATIQSHITGTVDHTGTVVNPPALDFLPIATAPIPGAPMPYTAYFPLVMVRAWGG